jgi:primosomal protein N' (replication factor Y) (superfamily II helicase)
MSSKELYVEIILPLPLEGTFSYKVPLHLANEIAIGKRVVVPLGNRKMYTGIVAEISDKPRTDRTIKELLEVLDEVPIVHPQQFEMWKWIAHYYMCSVGEVFKAALPSGLQIDSETRISLHLALTDYSGLSKREIELVSMLEAGQPVSTEKIRKALNLRSVMSLVKLLLEKEVIILEEQLRSGFKPKLESYVRLGSDFLQESKLNEVLDNMKGARMQQQILITFLQMTRLFDGMGANTLKKKILLKESGAGDGSMKSLLKKGILEQYEIPVSRIGVEERKIEPLKVLTPQQSDALAEIKALFESKDTILLHGVTSSGKTEVYIHLIHEMINKGKQVLYLLPEIALTAQIVDRLKIVFGDKVGVYHSKYSNTERVEIWNNVLRNEATSYQIILGARSSVFIPFSNLGLIIVDEEHETSFKQYSPAPRYNARDLAVVLSGIFGGKTLLGTATPSIESYFNTSVGKYGLVEMLQRYQDIELPKVQIANVRLARFRKQMQYHFTPMLMDELRAAFAKNEQAILFQNRRGFSPYLECEECSYIPKCTKCDVSLTYHKKFNRLLCHYCGVSQGLPHKCPDCNGEKIETRGFGTEKVEDEISLLFPDIKVARLDFDTTRTRKSYEKIINDFSSGKVDLLVGTQMVSKGLDFDNVSVVGVLNADNMLNFPDFRAYERSYQLMAQVSGRAGRKNKQGKVVVQTSDAGHPIVKFVFKNDYHGMFQSQLEERKLFNYPPYSRLIKLILRHKQPDVLNKAAKDMAGILLPVFGRNLLGPEYPLVARIQNYYLKAILLKTPKDGQINRVREVIKQAKKQMNERQPGVQITIDVDPM